MNKQEIDPFASPYQGLGNVAHPIIAEVAAEAAEPDGPVLRRTEKGVPVWVPPGFDKYRKVNIFVGVGAFLALVITLTLASGYFCLGWLLAALWIGALVGGVVYIGSSIHLASWEKRTVPQQTYFRSKRNKALLTMAIVIAVLIMLAWVFLRVVGKNSRDRNR